MRVDDSVCTCVYLREVKVEVVVEEEMERGRGEQDGGNLR